MTSEFGTSADHRHVTGMRDAGNGAASSAEAPSPRHTPGPWSVPHFAQPDVNCECGYVLCDEHMGAICTVHCSGEGKSWELHGDNPKFQQAVANAHLIAAAPELLAAALLLIAASDEGDADKAMDGYDALRAAIAKATSV